MHPRASDAGEITMKRASKVVLGALLGLFGASRDTVSQEYVLQPERTYVAGYPTVMQTTTVPNPTTQPTIYREERYKVQRPVWETEEREERVTVRRPVYETSI